MRSPFVFPGGMFRSSGWALVLGLGMVYGLSSCAASKTAQCKTLMLMTQKMAETSAQYRNSTQEKDVLAIADQFEKTADKIANLSLTDETLADYQQRLVTIYRGNGEATRTMVKALASKDILTARLAQEKVNAIGQQEQEIITQINRHCQTP